MKITYSMLAFAALALTCLMTPAQALAQEKEATTAADEKEIAKEATADDAKSKDAKAEEGKDKEGKAEEEEEKEPTPVSLGEGKLSMSVPGGWDKVQPRSRIVESEFKIPKVEGDEIDGRLTMMAASGGSKANISRWIGQFTQKDGTETRAKTEEKTISEMKVHVVDISGNFMDAPRGPFGPKIEREDFRMLAAIVETGTSEYYLKLYGPKKTISKNEAKFKKLVESFKGK